MSRLVVAAATVLAISAAEPVLLAPSAGAETPAERCSRETSAYDAAWEASWAAANPNGGSPPPPPVPYICRDPAATPEPTPSSVLPAPALPGSTSAAPEPTRERVGSNAPTNFPEYSGTDIVPLPGLPELGRLAPTPTPAPLPLDSAEPVTPLTESSITIDDILAACRPVAIPRSQARSELSPSEQASYAMLRNTQSAEYRAARRRIEIDIDSGLYGDKFEGVDWDADHVISLNRLVQTPGFTTLPQADQLAIAHSPENLKPLRQGWNRSKRADSVYDWEGPKSGTSPTPTEQERVELCEDEGKATAYILDQISLRSSPPEREDSADGSVSVPPTAPPTGPPSLTDTPTVSAEEVPLSQQTAPATPEWTPERTASIDVTTPAWTEPSQLPAQPSPEIPPPPVTSSTGPPVEAPRITSRPSMPRSSAPSRPSTATEDEDDDSFWEKAAPYAAGAGLIALGIAVAPAAPVLGAGAVIGGIAGAATG